MRILNVMFGRGQGGIEQAAMDYACALELRGHSVHTLIQPGAAVAEPLKERGFKVAAIGNWGEWDPIAVWKIRTLLRALKPDIAIAHGNRAIALLKAAGAPNIVGVTHNYKTRCAGLAAIFCISEDLMDYARNQGVPADTIYHIPNMVALAPLKEKRPWGSPVRIASMGRFVTKKGFDLYIEALAQLKARGISFHATLAGGGEEETSLKALAAQHNLGDALAFAGWVENKEDFLDAADIFCLPSRHEPFGIVLLEAMAQSLPVVAASSEGPSRIITHEKDGLLVAKDSVQALASGLETLIKDEATARALGDKARRTIEERYDMRVVAAKLDLALRCVAKL